MAIKELKSLTFGDGDTYVIPTPEPTAWNEIPGNPFGGGSSTISWASRGIDPTTLPEATWVKMSDAVVTWEDVANVTADDEVFTFFVFSDDGYAEIATNVSYGFPQAFFPVRDDTFGCFVIDYNGNDYLSVEFRPDGVFFFTGYDYGGVGAYPLSVTVPGFGKFESYAPIDSKYLPEGLQTETISLTDTITIDRVVDDNWNIDAAKVVGMKWIGDARMVSGANIPVKSCSGGENYYTLGQGQNEDGWFQLDAQEIANGFYRILMTDENGNTLPGGYCATDGCGYDTGLYLNEWGDASFTFDGGAIFETRTPKPIDKKYLPNDIGGIPEVTAEDNGKFLRVVDGAWAAVALPIYNGEVEDA